MAAFLLMASIFHLKSSFWVETNGWKQHMWECWNIPGFLSTFTDSIRDGNDPSWDTDGNFKEWKNSVGVSYLQAREGCVLGVVAAFHQNEPVLALKVRVAAHSPPQPPNPPSCRGLCTAVASEQTKEDKMASLQLWLRVLGMFLLLFAFQGEFSSFLPYSWFPF